MAYSIAVRRSRAPATRVCWRTFAMSVAMVSAMVSITPKVTRYCTSLTANVKRGGTKKKSKARDIDDGRQHRRAASEPQAGRRRPRADRP